MDICLKLILQCFNFVIDSCIESVWNFSSQSANPILF